MLTNVRVAYRTWGTLSTAADNCVVVAHSLTDNAAIDTWWAAMLVDGRAFDTSRYFVVCANMLGSCYGTTGPLDTARLRPHAVGGAEGQRHAALPRPPVTGTPVTSHIRRSVTR